MSSFYKILKAGILGGLLLLDPDSVSAKEIKNNPLNLQSNASLIDLSKVCPASYIGHYQHDYCLRHFILSKHFFTLLSTEEFFDESLSSDDSFFLSPIKKIVWHAQILFYNKEDLLFDAIKQNDLNKVDFLINNKANVNAIGFRNQTPLHQVKHLEIAKLLIENGADKEAKDLDDETPLQKHIHHPKIAELLIEKGADIHVKDWRGQTPLHQVQNVRIAELLIEKGADVNAKDQSGQTPLHLVEHIEIAQLLIDNGAHVNELGGHWNEVPLHSVRNLEIAELLIKEGANVNAKDEYGRTPLHNAPNTQIALALINNKANVNAKDSKDITPLHLAYKAGVARALINNGADINAKDLKGRTPLHTVVDREVVRVLINHKADVNAKDLKGLTPLQKHIFARPKIAKLLIENRADVNIKDEEGNSFLHRVQDEELIKSLIENRAEVNAKDSEGLTPLQKHIFHRPKIAKLLIENRADVNIKDAEGNSLLHLVQDEELIELLIENRGDVNAVDKFNQNPLHLAKTDRLAKLLLRKGAKVFRGRNENDRAFVFQATYDWNGVFSTDLQRYFVSNLTLDYFVGQRTIEDPEQLIESLDQVPFKSLNAIVISAHGSPQSICFRKDSEKTVRITIDNFSSIEEKLRHVFLKALSPNATVILDSCSTAQDKNSIAYYILKTLPKGTKLIASKEVTNLFKIVSLKPIHLNFYNDGTDVTVNLLKKD